MAGDTNSPILGLLIMGDGLHTNNWGDETNDNLTTLENAIKGTSSIVVTGNATLSQQQCAAAILLFSGSLTADTTITVPATSNQWTVQNNTTGAFKLNLQVAGGNSVEIAQGSTALVATPNGASIASLVSNNDLVPLGTVIEYPSLTPPNENYVLADGSAISRTAFASYFALVGTTFGAGDSFTTFNIPDRRGRTAFMADNGSGRLNSWAIGHTAGAQNGNITLATTNLPQHNHGINDPTHNHGYSDPTHAHPISGPSNAISSPIFAAYNAGGQSVGVNINPFVIGNNSIGITISNSGTGISTQNAGSGTAFSVLAPLIVMGFHVRVK